MKQKQTWKRQNPCLHSSQSTKISSHSSNWLINFSYRQPYPPYPWRSDQAGCVAQGDRPGTVFLSSYMQYAIPCALWPCNWIFRIPELSFPGLALSLANFAERRTCALLYVSCVLCCVHVLRCFFASLSLSLVLVVAHIVLLTVRGPVAASAWLGIS